MVNNLKNIKECEGVPGGLTFGDVSGMGDIRFPVENGNPQGSGDLPKPSGHVYKQIMPFDSFVKSPDWKKRKKRKNKKEPMKDSSYYKHSPNPSVYKHVYDFKEYIKRVKEEL